MSSAAASKRWERAFLTPQRSPARVSLPLYLALLAALACAVFTLAAWYVTWRTEKEVAQRQTIARANAIATAIEDRLDAYISVLQAGAGLFDASDEVTYSDWLAFTHRLRASPIFPGVQGVGFAVRVHRPEDFERYRSGQPMRMWPDSQDPQRTAIVYLQPLTSRNRAALGFDMMSETTRRAAMERARDTTLPALSGKVSLVQEITEDKQAGFLLYIPVYQRDSTLTTIESRREALHGFVYSPFRVVDFLRGVLGGIPRDLSIAIYDGPIPSTEALLYGTSRAPGEGAERREIVLAGHRWTLIVQPQGRQASGVREDSRWIALGGSIASLLVAAAVFALALSRQHAREKLQVEHALLERERFATAVIDNSLDAYISVDRDDRILEWNKKAEEIFGWAAVEVRGALLSETIVPPALRERHVAAVRASSGTPGKVLGRRLEMPARTRSGKEILVELSILAVQRVDQLTFVASLRDISKQREQEVELRTLNENLERAVVERTSALEQANSVLRSTNEQLDAFTRNVSHDLRAPLRAIEGYARLAAEEGETHLTGASKSHLRAVLKNVERMQSIIDALLRLAWIGQQPLRAQRVDIWKIVLDVVNELSAQRAFVLRAQPDSLECVWGDPTLLEHALRNLLTNAVKFSSKTTEPTVEVGMETAGGEDRYYVRDNGVGFDTQHSSNLFQVFGRLHRADEFEGTGIGLTIVKTVVERHGGRIWAESAPGKGATFWFTLPRYRGRHEAAVG